jgi:NAD kinase
MRALLFGDHSETLRPLLERHGFTLVESGSTSPAELVVCHGGDGTVLRAEHEHPGIPKLLLRGSRVCKLCSKLDNDEVLKRVSEGQYTIHKLLKLEARTKGTVLVGMNDIIVHNADARHGIRYRLSVNGERVGGEIIGDGIVVATPLGSTGYYRSITDSFFTNGVGVAFNNSTEQSDHIVLGDDSVIELTVTRGPAIAYADNHSSSITLADSDKILIKKSDAVAQLIVPEAEHILPMYLIRTLARLGREWSAEDGS